MPRRIRLGTSNSKAALESIRSSALRFRSSQMDVRRYEANFGISALGRSCAMDEQDPREEISALEALIEEMAETVEHCRKLIILSKVALGLGALSLCGFMLGVLGDGPL